MKEYVIYTDSACDVKPELLAEWGVKVLPLTFRFTNEDKEYSNYDMPVSAFYDRMKKGEVAKTSAINSAAFSAAFESELKNGCDVLYLAFSSGLSTTYNSAMLAASQLMKIYKDSRIEVVNTLTASAGLALLVDLVVEKKKSGASLDEAADFARSTAPSICHWFTVDDLVYLKRGGRISPAAAFFGNVIGIKPVLHVDDEGHLVNVMKVRGRKNSVSALAESFGRDAIDKNGKIFISHACCAKDVDELAAMLKEKYGASVDLVTDVGPVIGAHSGPGTLALFYVGKVR